MSTEPAIIASPGRHPHASAAAAPCTIAATAAGVLRDDANANPNPEPAGREHHAIATIAARGTACDAIRVSTTRGVARYSKDCQRASTLSRIATAPYVPIRLSLRIDRTRSLVRPVLTATATSA